MNIAMARLAEKLGIDHAKMTREKMAEVVSEKALLHIIELERVNHIPAAGEVFGVIAGKYEGNEINCKYSAEFPTLDEAIESYDQVISCPWAYILYKGRILGLFSKTFYPLDFPAAGDMVREVRHESGC
jgi:hypothetical protein